jgi:hypothetical protein
MKKQPTSPARSKGYVATLPFRSRQIDDPAANFDASVWRLPENACEYRDTGQCDTAAGVYYGSAEDDVARFCPRHFYVLHFGPNAPYRFIDPAGGEQTPSHTPDQAHE